MRTLLLCGLFIAALVAAGCGEKPKSRIHGKITYLNKPLTDATIIFLASDNSTYTAELSKEGTYAVAGVTQGPIRVSIQQALPSVSPRADPDPTGRIAAAKAAKVGDEKGARPAPPPSTPKERKVTLPKKYNDPAQSGLSFELNDPDQEWSVNLN